MPVKTIAVIDQSELKDGQLKEVDFEDGKVLLSRIGDKVHATSAFCTHYGAPLAKGVLTADGRVVCPWHGACFNVCTGDIEDAPAPSPIHSFRASIDQSTGKINVTADPALATKDKMARPKRLEASYESNNKGGVVIVGGGSAAFQAVESLRENGFKGSITVLSREKYAPIDRTKLSKALITDASKLEWRDPETLKIKYGVNLRTGVTATGLDTASRTVTITSPFSASAAPNTAASQGEKVSYDSLILATGGMPRKLPVDGKDLEGIFTLRGVEHAKEIDAAVTEGKRIVVIGSSFISMELVAFLSGKREERKFKSIDVIGMEEFPFEAVLGKQVGAGLLKYHKSKDITFHMTSKVLKLSPSTENSSAVGSVTIQSSNGGEEKTLDADVVIMGVGVAPATEWLKDSGFQLKDDGGLEVDSLLRVKGHESANVYAVGDIAHYPQVDGSLSRIEHWNVAGNHGRAVGRTIALGEKDAKPFDKVPVFWSAQGQQLRYCGLGKGFDDVIINGDPGELKFIAYYLKSGKVVAVASMQNDPVVSKASELMRLGLMPTADEIRGGKNLLEVDISSAAQKDKVDH